MNTTPTNSELQPPVEAPNIIRQETTRNHYRRRDIPFSLFYPDVDQTFQAFNPNSDKDYTTSTSATERNQDGKIIEPESADEDILDPEGEHLDREFPKKEEHDDINPNRNVPEEDNDLNDVDGGIIEEPTRELDDPYRTGHAERENIPPIKEEFPETFPLDTVTP